MPHTSGGEGERETEEGSVDDEHWSQRMFRNYPNPETHVSFHRTNESVDRRWSKGGEQHETMSIQEEVEMGELGAESVERQNNDDSVSLVVPIKEEVKIMSIQEEVEMGDSHSESEERQHSVTKDHDDNVSAVLSIEEEVERGTFSKSNNVAADSERPRSDSRSTATMIVIVLLVLFSTTAIVVGIYGGT